MAERVQQCLKGAVRNSRACSRTGRGGAPPSRKANQEASTASTSSGGGAAATSDAGAGVAMSLAFGIRCGTPGAAEPHTRRQPGAHLACKASSHHSGASSHRGGIPRGCQISRAAPAINKVIPWRSARRDTRSHALNSLPRQLIYSTLPDTLQQGAFRYERGGANM